MKKVSASIAVLLITILAFRMVTVSASAQGTKKTPSAPSAKPETPLPFTGTWVGTYHSNQGQSSMTLMMQQLGNTVTGTYLIPSVGAQGVLYGAQTSGTGKFDVDQKTPNCPGHFTMEGTVKGSDLTFTFKGSHCGGTENGTGKVTKLK